jgi:hypothetical protein
VAGARRDHVLAAGGAKPGSAEDYPFGDEVAVLRLLAGCSRWCLLGRRPGQRRAGDSARWHSHPAAARIRNQARAEPRQRFRIRALNN